MRNDAPPRKPGAERTARLKLLAAVVFLTVVMTTDNFYLLGNSLLAAVALALPAGMSPRKLLRGLAGFLPFLAAGAVFSGNEQNPGELHLVLVPIFRVLIALLVAIILTGTTSIEGLCGAIAWFISPLRRLGIDTARFGTSLALGISLAPAVTEECRRFVKDRFKGRKIRLSTLPREIAAVIEEVIHIGIRKLEKIQRQ